jgi:hypothetical protein
VGQHAGIGRDQEGIFRLFGRGDPAVSRNPGKIVLSNIRHRASHTLIRLSEQTIHSRPLIMAGLTGSTLSIHEHSGQQYAQLPVGTGLAGSPCLLNLAA